MDNPVSGPHLEIKHGVYNQFIVAIWWLFGAMCLLGLQSFNYIHPDLATDVKCRYCAMCSEDAYLFVAYQVYCYFALVCIGFIDLF
jgi:hypothetical protein